MARVLITGANRGIGLELTRLFTHRGDDVVAVVRSSSPELDALGVRVEADVDMSDDTLGGLAERLGDLSFDLVVANAGVLTVQTLDELDLDGIRHQFEVNTLGPLKLAAALRGRLGTGSKLVLITSRMGSIEDNDSGSFYGYRMSKAALNMACKSLSIDLKPKGVAVCVLHPGWVQTAMTRGSGNTSPAVSAARLLERMDALTLETTGGFWHAEGQTLPW